MTPNSPQDEEAIRRMSRMTRRGFAIGGVAAAAGFAGWSWLNSRSAADGLPWPFRRVHEANEIVGRRLYSERLAQEHPTSAAAEPRVNGLIGWRDTGEDGEYRFRPHPPAGEWVLTVTRPDWLAPRIIPLAALTALPRVESVTELKCVEGWSQVVHWGGVRFADFLRTFDLLPPEGSPFQYLQLLSPSSPLPGIDLDNQPPRYTSALDLPSVLHPQTLLCDTMNGAPLTKAHGGPIRLVLPIKYGIKNIKWLTEIRFSANKPTDYWTQRGYDWYAGL